MSVDLDKHPAAQPAPDAWGSGAAGGAGGPIAAIDPTNRQLAALGHGLSFIEGGILGPLVLYVVKREASEFVAFHALQSLYFGLVFLAIVTLSCGVALPLALVYIGFEVMATIEASNGVWYQLPLVGEWAWRKHNPETARALGQPL